MRFLKSILFTFYFLLFTFLVNAQTTNYISHTIASGETLTALAKQYHTTVGAIMRLNHMNTQSVLTIGEIVKIPSAQTIAAKPVAPTASVAATQTVDTTNKIPVTHIVGKGESLYSIAKKYHVYIAQIKTWNNLKTDVIIDGKSLIVGYSSLPATVQTKIVTAPETQSQQPSEPVENNVSVQTQPQVTQPVTDSASSITTNNIPSSAATDQQLNTTVATPQPSQTEIANMQNPEGYFTSAFGIGTEGRSIQTASGTSMTFKTASGWNDKKYYILMNNVPPGSIVKIMAGNYKTIFAKVLWSMTAMKENDGLDFRISTAAASALGLSEAKFPLTVTYFE